MLTRLEQDVPNFSSSSSLAWFCLPKLTTSVWAPYSEKHRCYVPTELPAFLPLNSNYTSYRVSLLFCVQSHKTINWSRKYRLQNMGNQQNIAYSLHAHTYRKMLLEGRQNIYMRVEDLETNLMSLVILLTLNICSTCFEH